MTDDGNTAVVNISEVVSESDAPADDSVRLVRRQRLAFVALVTVSLVFLFLILVAWFTARKGRLGEIGINCCELALVGLWLCSWTLCRLAQQFDSRVTVGLLLTLLSIGLAWEFLYKSSEVLWLFIATVCIWEVLKFSRWALRAARKEDKNKDLVLALDIKVKILGVAGVGVAALTLVLGYHRGCIERFNSTKPLFDLSEVPTLEGSAIAFAVRNLGGWVMFLGVAKPAYLGDANPPLLRGRGVTLCKSVDIQETPGQHDVIVKKKLAKFRISRPDATCSILVGWVDADDNSYEQQIELRGANGKGNGQLVKISAPAHRAPSNSILSWFLDGLPLGPRQAHWIAPRGNRDADGDYCIGAATEKPCRFQSGSRW